jgi:hypothetical protein
VAAGEGALSGGVYCVCFTSLVGEHLWSGDGLYGMSGCCLREQCGMCCTAPVQLLVHVKKERDIALANQLS